MKDLEINLVNKTREAGLAKNRSVSFNGVSVMVDAIMNVYNSISNKKSELSNAVDTNNISIFYEKRTTKSGAMVFIFNLDKVSLMKLFPTMNI